MAADPWVPGHGVVGLLTGGTLSSHNTTMEDCRDRCDANAACLSISWYYWDDSASGKVSCWLKDSTIALSGTLDTSYETVVNFERGTYPGSDLLS